MLAFLIQSCVIGATTGATAAATARAGAAAAAAGAKAAAAGAKAAAAGAKAAAAGAIAAAAGAIAAAAGTIAAAGGTYAAYAFKAALSLGESNLDIRVSLLVVFFYSTLVVIRTLRNEFSYCFTQSTRMFCFGRRASL
jgi:hypothetical protein